jgi:GT2 family glycosyltransferase
MPAGEASDPAARGAQAAPGGQAPDLSVVVVSYNTRALLDGCLRAVAATVRRHRYEVIVADNGSRDGTVAMLRRHWPAVRLVETGANLGFARACNLGLRAARGRARLLLNSDTEVLPGALDDLVSFLWATPGAGVAAPRLLNSDLTDQGTARAFPTPAAVLFGRKSFLTRAFPTNPWSRRYLVGRAHRGDAPFRVDWVSGACLLIRQEVLERVGALDEGYFMYWEDCDWCRRIAQAGYGVYCVPRARVVHHEGQSSRGRPAHLVWAFHRSVYHYFTKFHAPQPWHPARLLVAAGLAGRAALLIVAGRLASSPGGPPASPDPPPDPPPDPQLDS